MIQYNTVYETIQCDNSFFDRDVAIDVDSSIYFYTRSILEIPLNELAFSGNFGIKLIVNKSNSDSNK